MTYLIYIFTFFIHPIIGYFLCRLIPAELSKKAIKYVLSFFVLHNVLYCLGISMRGDIADYCVFSLEYLYFCFLIFRHAGHSLWKLFGIVIVLLGYLQALIGIVIFPVISHDYEPDKLYRFEYKDNNYITRRYSFGFVTQMDIRYRFETYHQFYLLPLEFKIDETELLDTKYSLNYDDRRFTVSIVEKDGKELIRFASPNGNAYFKFLKPEQNRKKIKSM